MKVRGNYMLMRSGDLVKRDVDARGDGVFGSTGDVVARWRVTDAASAGEMLDDIDRKGYRGRLSPTSLATLYSIMEWKKTASGR